MFHDLFNINWWRRESRRIGLVLLRYCDKLQVQLEKDLNLTDETRKEIKDAIDQALNALKLVNSGHEYDSNNPNDPLRKAEDDFKKLVPKREWIQPSENRVPKDKLAAVTQMILDITDSATSTKCPIHVKLCDSSKNSANPISETLKYSIAEASSYTLDDLLYRVRLRRPDALVQYPHFYCRPVGAQRYTQEGSKFEQRNSSDPLMGLTWTKPEDESDDEHDTVGVVYLISPRPEFVLLVEGVPFKPRGKDKDRFHIVNNFEDLTTEVIAGSRSQTRTFHHIKDPSWNYRCDPDEDSKTTWRVHKKKKQLTPYQGEWFICVG